MLLSIINDLNSFTPAELIQVMQTFSTYSSDLTGCLVNCTNQGKCKLDSLTKKLICACDRDFSGSSCQASILPCSKLLCLNNGTCSNVYNETVGALYNYTYTCQCKKNYYGQNCEKQVNLCLNVNCSSHGYCLQGNCKCFYGYNGTNCELTNTFKEVVFYVQLTSLIILLFSLAIIVLFVTVNDILNCTICRKERKQIKKADVIAKVPKYHHWPKETQI